MTLIPRRAYNQPVAGDEEIQSRLLITMVETQTLAIVIAIYNEQENLPELFRRLRETFGRMPDIAPTVIYVNDGSSDDSLRIMLEQRTEDPRFTVIDLSRNFGHQHALKAGMNYAKGDVVISMDADMQHPPEIINEMLQKWREGYDIVYTIRNEENTSFLKRFTSKFFYKIFN